MKDEVPWICMVVVTNHSSSSESMFLNYVKETRVFFLQQAATDWISRRSGQA